VSEHIAASIAPASKVLVVIPTYREVANIEQVIVGVRRHLPHADVVVVDDGSTDGTVEVVVALAARDSKIGLMQRDRRGGLGDAYRAGFTFGLRQGYEILVEMDGDRSHDPAYLPEIVSAAVLGADAVIGSRYVPGGSVVGWSRRRWWLSRWGNRYAALSLGLAVNDCTSGYRAYRAALLRNVDLSCVRADGFAFQVEMTYYAVNHGGRIVEIPIVFKDRVAGASKMSSSIVLEAFAMVTWWGLRDVLTLARRRRAYRRR
jgi:glycosyltransferase involved in cell wall biosynthesis